MKIGKNHHVIKELKELLKKTNKDNLVVTDDINIIDLAIKRNLEFMTFIYCDEIDDYKEETIKLINKCTKFSRESYTISKQLFDSLAQKENSIGLIAIIKLHKYVLDDLLNKDFLVVCDGLEIPGNLGTIYRTLDSINVDGMILVDSMTKITNPKLTSSSRGTSLLIPTVDIDFVSAVSWLVKNEYTIYLGEPKLGKSYRDYDYNGKIAIVVGNERFGINSKWYDNPHQKVFIPMYGSNNSLNVGVAASILTYEAKMKRLEKFK